MDTPQKILIIEDDRALQSALMEMLSQEGYETISAYDGQEGMEKAEVENPH